MGRPYALLMNGAGRDSEEFVRDCRQLRKYLTDVVGYDPLRVWRINAREATLQDPEVLQECIDGFFDASFLDDPSADVVLFYSGHGLDERTGSPAVMDINALKLPYGRFVSRLQGRRYLFINDCCHSGAAIPALGDIIDQGQIICSTRRDESSVGQYFFHSMLRNVQRRMPIGYSIIASNETPRNGEFPITYEGAYQYIQREGLVLDHLLYPRA
jgi:hypothetical protein